MPTGNTKKVLTTLILSAILAGIISNPFFASADSPYIVTETAFTLIFDLGESFQIQDIQHNAWVIFEVTAGSLNASAELTVDNYEGELTVTPTAPGTLAIEPITVG